MKEWINERTAECRNECMNVSDIHTKEKKCVTNFHSPDIPISQKHTNAHTHKDDEEKFTRHQHKHSQSIYYVMDQRIARIAMQCNAIALTHTRTHTHALAHMVLLLCAFAICTEGLSFVLLKHM